MKRYHLLYGLLLLSGLATAANGVTELSSQQQFLNQRNQQAQQQRMLNNQQLDQRRLQQQRQFDNNQQQLQPNSPNNCCQMVTNHVTRSTAPRLRCRRLRCRLRRCAHEDNGSRCQQGRADSGKFLTQVNHSENRGQSNLSGQYKYNQRPSSTTGAHAPVG